MFAMLILEQQAASIQNGGELFSVNLKLTFCCHGPIKHQRWVFQILLIITISYRGT